MVDAADSGGLLKFLGGVVLGLVLRSLVPSLIEQDPPPRKSPAKRQPSRPPALAAPREELKMVLCVNQSLNMGKGKIGAQCAHAATGILTKYRAHNEAAFRMWERFGQPKIALKVQDEQQMAVLAQGALAAGLPVYIVHDAGRTQVAAGSQTVLAIGPGYKSEVNKITGHLSLL